MSPAPMVTTRPELTGTFGAVTSTHWLASASGMAVLEAGGNAFDAAVATALTLHVVEPHLNGPGGDAPILFSACDGEPRVLCGQAPAPAAATIEHYVAEGLDEIPGTGLLAASIPGAMPAWLVLLRDHGTLPLRDVARFAIGYARDGHPVLARTARTIDSMAGFFAQHWPSSAAQWSPSGRAPAADELVRNPGWADTLDRLCRAADGAASREAGIDAALQAWRQGFVAEAIDAFVRTPVQDASGSAHAGVLSGQDMAGWTPGYEAPVSLSWRGQRVHKCGPWSQGPVLLEQLALLDPLLPDHSDDWTVEIVHHALEVAKLALADRDAWFGDSGDSLLDVADLLDPDFLDARRRLVGEQASAELRPGWVRGIEPRMPRGVRLAGEAPPRAAGMGEPTVRSAEPTRGDTCHLDVVDRWGNVVSATPSGGWLQSSPHIPALGFCLGSRLQMCWLEPGLPSSLQPGRRPRTTLTPSLAVDEHTGRVLAFGTPGGDQQDQWQLVFWLAHTVLGRPLQAALDTPAWHSDAVVSSFAPRVWTPLAASVEDRLGVDLIDGLRQRGHVLNVVDGWSLGRTTAASYDPATGLVRAAANARTAQGYAVCR